MVGKYHVGGSLSPRLKRLRIMISIMNDSSNGGWGGGEEERPLIGPNFMQITL